MKKTTNVLIVFAFSADETRSTGIFHTSAKARLYQCHHLANQYELEMWANVQRDGRPAEYTWRPLFNAAVWLDAHY